jgi:hypothetical protein
MAHPRPAIQLPKSYNNSDLFTQIKTQHYEAEPSIIILTLYRPKNHNAFTNTMMLELERAYGMFDVDDRVKCIVFTGHGRIFCAGADLDVGFVGGQEPVNEHRDGWVDFALPLYNSHNISHTSFRLPALVCVACKNREKIRHANNITITEAAA